VHQTESQKVEVIGSKPSSEKVQVYSITGDSWNVNNMGGSEKVGIKESEWNGEGSFEFPSFSVTMLRWKP
jgi:alpha-N-arabinofuranosidase